MLGRTMTPPVFPASPDGEPVLDLSLLSVGAALQTLLREPHLLAVQVRGDVTYRAMLRDPGGRGRPLLCLEPAEGLGGSR